MTLDILDQLFARGSVCVVKMNPVNGYLSPFYAASIRRANAAHSPLRPIATMRSVSTTFTRGRPAA